jgi:hypothetical protein
MRLFKERSGFGLLALGALGVVYGDIGTSPLYAIKEVFTNARHPVSITADNVLGLLSLIFWSLMVVVSLKYVVLVLRADNRGERGNHGPHGARRGALLLLWGQRDPTRAAGDADRADERLQRRSSGSVRTPRGWPTCFASRSCGATSRKLSVQRFAAAVAAQTCLCSTSATMRYTPHTSTKAESGTTTGIHRR